MRLFLRVAAFVVLLPMTAVAAGERTPGDLYILAIGIEPELTGKGERDPYAGDAVFVAKAMSQAQSLYAHTHRRVLAGKNASRSNVLKGLEWLSGSAKEGDLVVVFFSAHGDVHAGKGYAIDLAASKDETIAPLLWGTELNESLRKIRGKTVLFLDTCCAAGVIQGARIKPDRIGVLASCKADESSDGQWERPDRPHGWFVIALCEALSGLADSDQDGIVTLAEVAAYVPSRARGLYQEQNAIFASDDAVSNAPLARFDRKQEPPKLWP